MTNVTFPLTSPRISGAFPWDGYEQDKTWLYDPRWLGKWHGAAAAHTAIQEAMARALSSIAAKVTSNPDD